MEDQIRPAHECDRCGCDVLTKHTDPSGGDEFLVCARCQFVQGEELSVHDWLIRQMYAVHDQIGQPRPEDISAFEQGLQEPPETYELEEPSAMELEEMFERADRICEAMRYPIDVSEAAELAGGEGDGIDGQMPIDGGDADTGTL
jgi:hypothetical protein